MIEVAVIGTGIVVVLTIAALITDCLEGRRGRKQMPVECDWCKCPTLLFDPFSLDYRCSDCRASL